MSIYGTRVKVDATVMTPAGKDICPDANGR